MGFPYNKGQIDEVVATEKHPRDWEPLAYKGSGSESLSCEAALDRMDGKADRIRLILRAGRVEVPTSYRASLLLEDARIRGIDHHAVARKRFYKETIPAGWHEDIIDPNREAGEKGGHVRVALADFDPLDPYDFMKRVCTRWHITQPPGSETLV